MLAKLSSPMHKSLVHIQGTKITKGDYPHGTLYHHRFAYLVLQRPHHRAHGKQQSGNVAVQGSGFGGLDTGIFGKASAFNAKFNLKSVSDPSAQIEVSQVDIISTNMH